MIPPLFVTFYVRTEGFWLPLWLPVFLLWLLLLPVALVASLVVAPLWLCGFFRNFVLVAWHSWCVFCSLRGMRIDVASKDARVLVSIV